MQSVTAVLRLGELELEGHAVHTLDPESAEYLPATQSAHTVLADVPVYFPATHALHVLPFSPL